MLAPLAASTHEPTLMGEVSLTMRSMFMKRAGRPRSEMSSAGLASTAAPAVAHARRASSSQPRSSASWASPAEAPARPPVKKYHGISGVQTGSLITGWP